MSAAGAAANSAGSGDGAAIAAAVAKTCVTTLDAKPDADGDYVMFDGTNYTVFKLPVTKLDNVAADSKFFKVVEKPMAGGRRKSRKSSKKQRKSRGSRRSKK